MIRNRKRLWALLLSAVMIVTQLPAVAMAENNTPEDGSIASFEPLDNGVANQTVEVGTELSALTLPDAVTASVYHVTEDTVIPDEDNIEDDGGDTSTATPSDAEGSVSGNDEGQSPVKDSGKTVTTITTSEEQIPVSWNSEPAYDGNTEGSYVFTADVGGYVLSGGAKLPTITVTVAADTVEKPTGESLPCTQTEGCTLANGHEGDCVPAPPSNDGLVKTITSWTFVATNYSDYAGNELALPGVSMEQQADFDTVVSMLPTQLSALIEGEADPATLDIAGWTCPEYIPDGEGNWPLTGDYTFTAALADGYALASDAEALEVLVTFGGGTLYSTINDGYSFFNGNLTISSNDGTTNWRNDTSINKADVLSLTIQDTVTSIGNNAFMGCTGLMSIDKLPTGLTSIGNSTFRGCTGLTSIDKLPTGLTSIGNYTFSGCTGLTSIDKLPTGLTSIGNSTFSGCTGLTSIDKLPTGLTSIGYSTFEGCTGLTSIDKLPTGLTSIGDYTFEGCTGLTSIDNLPAGLTSIGDYTFYGCTGLTSIDNLPAGLTSIGDSTFYGCTGLTSIDLTGLTGLTSIGDNTFYGCTGLTSIDKLPAGLTSIGNYTFWNCTGLTSIDNLPAGLTSIGKSTFYGCTGLTSIDNLPAGLTSIGDYMFDGCTGLTEIIIPEGVTSIGGWALLDCTNLKTIVFLRKQAPTFGTAAIPSISPAPVVYVPEGASGYESLSVQTVTMTAPAIAAQPQDVTVTAGITATFTVTADGAPSPAYQWQVNTGSGWSDVADGTGGNTDSYTTPATNVGMNDWQYQCVITNIKDTVTTSAVTLTVNALTNAKTPAITNQPQGGTYTQNTSATLTVTANVSDGGTLTYQWYSNTTDSNTGGKAISGADTASYTAPTGTVGTTYYYVVVINTNDSVSGQKTADATSSTAAVTVTAAGGSTGGGGSSDSGNGSSVTTQTPQPTANDPNPPTVGKITPSVTVDKDGKVTVSVSDRDIQSAIDKATAQAKKDGTLANGIAVSIDLTGLKTQFNTLPLTLSRTVYQKLVDAGVNSMSIATPQISLSLDLETLKTIYTNATGNVTINAVKAENSKLPAGMQNRPAYDLTIISGGKQISDFGKGNIAVTLPYTLQGTEQGGNLQMAYVDTEGKVRNMTNSSYHANQSAMIGRTNHFTVFGIVQKPAPAFKDIEGHWANDDILFVASRELLSGTGNNLFSPDTGMTRGMFVTALGRLAGIDQTQYKNTKFSDVAATAYYAPYVAWAAEKGIVNGTTDTTFAPDTNISREQMAVIMQNYALACGYTVPKTRAAVTFADSSSIESWAKDAVKAMQMAGVMNGKDGNRFDPKASATRAEVAAVLRRFVEIVIDPVTAQGWGKNDSGQWLYYKDGKALTGWKQIGSKWYYFDKNGIMAVNTKVDGYEIGPDGARKEDN